MQWPPLPDYGCFVRWPEEGYGFIHPDDRTTVLRLIPSERVLRRERFDGTYYHYCYGSIRFRLRPAMWLPVSASGIDIGDEVETLPDGMQREGFVAKIWGMYYIQRKGRVLYRLKTADGNAVPKLFEAGHFRLLTDKQRVEPGAIEYPSPRWSGSDENRLPVDPG